MRKTSILLSIYIILSLCSCATKMTIENSAKLKAPDEFASLDEPDMEFIGFKADTNILSTSSNKNIKINGLQSTYSFMPEFEYWKAFKNESSLKQLGSILEKNNIAYDKSFAYFGIYSLQELELYKSQKRFVTFVQVNKNKLDGEIRDPGYWPGLFSYSVGGGLLIGCIPFFGDPYIRSSMQPLAIAGGLLMVGGLAVMAIPCSSDLKFIGEYEIYVYDTLNKEIVYKSAITVNRSDKFSGSYFHKDTDIDAVNEYYATYAYNAILEKYGEVSKFIRSYNN